MLRRAIASFTTRPVGEIIKHLDPMSFAANYGAADIAARRPYPSLIAARALRR
jgi:hypothetical protein